jgi:hypothetical protein
MPKIKKCIHPDSFFHTKDENMDLKNFLMKYKNNSLSAKFLLGGADDYYNFETCQAEFEKHVPLLKEIILREATHPLDTFVFYNGASNAIKFFRMVVSTVYKTQEIESSLKSNFVASKMKNYSLTSQLFLEKKLDIKRELYPFNQDYDLNKPLIFDHDKSVRKNILAGSLLLNDGRLGETAWHLFDNNMSMCVDETQECKFLEAILHNFFHKLGYDSFPVNKLLDVYKQYKATLQAQLLQIFVKEEAFNQLGYYAYAGGVPVVQDSASFLHELIEEMQAKDAKDWKSVVSDKITRYFEVNKLYHLANRQDSPMDVYFRDEGKTIWLDLLQVRLITSNPDFYNSEQVTINEYYQSEEQHKTAKSLKAELKNVITQSTLGSFLSQNNL